MTKVRQGWLDLLATAQRPTTMAALEQLAWSPAQLDAALARIGETLRQIYKRADEQGISAAVAADLLADERSSRPNGPPAPDHAAMSP